jgi:predicted RNA-binding Zn ribbon-like protein
MASPATPYKPAGAPLFELTGGALCLDLANTWGDRARPETDDLRDYHGLLAFALQTRTLSQPDAARLRRRADLHRAEASAAWRRAQELREVIYRLFAALAAGRRPAAADLEQLNRALPAALVRLRIARGAGGFEWGWADRAVDLEAPLGPILRSTAELLTSADVQRVRQCAGASCTWLFLDRSHNRARRWCDMKTCGNRAKARRHYRRRKTITNPGR